MIASDSDLIARVVGADDRKAFGELVLRHQSAVRNFLRHLTGNDAALADDLAQETFLQAYRSLPSYRGEGRFTTWVFGIAHNQFRNEWRRKKGTFEGQEDHWADPTDLHTREVDLRHDFAAALRQISPDEQTAVHLFYQQGLSHPEIAQIAGWPLGTVKTHLARAKDKAS